MSRQFVTCQSCGRRNRIAPERVGRWTCGQCGEALPGSEGGQVSETAKSSRFFRHDVFLSHNQHDGSADLVKALAAQGVRAWHDGDADISDLNVQRLVMHELKHARFVCVCAGRDFRYSEWVAAEVEAARAIQERANVQSYMLVAELAPDPPLPSVLQRLPRFRVFEGAHLARLAALLRAGNDRTDVVAEFPAQEAQEMREEARRLRSYLSQHRDFNLSEREQLKLFLARVQAWPIITSTSESGPDALDFCLSWTGITQPYSLVLGVGPASGGSIYGYAKSGETAELQLCADIFACLAARRDLMESLLLRGEWELNLETMLGPLAQLAEVPSHREAAVAHYRCILSIAAETRKMPRARVRVYEARLAAKLAGRAFDIRDELGRLTRTGTSLVDIAVLALGCLALLSFFAIVAMMLFL